MDVICFECFVLLFLELESKFSCQFNLDVYFSHMMDLHGHDKIIARDLELPDGNIFRKFYVLHLSKTSGENKVYRIGIIL